MQNPNLEIKVMSLGDAFRKASEIFKEIAQSLHDFSVAAMAYDEKLRYQRKVAYLRRYKSRGERLKRDERNRRRRKRRPP